MNGQKLLVRTTGDGTTPMRVPLPSPMIAFCVFHSRPAPAAVNSRKDQIIAARALRATHPCGINK
jgi:hypothetical protein